MTMKPMITFPPLTDCDGKHELVSSVTFAVSPYSLEITTDGAGAYLAVEIEGRTRLNPDELMWLGMDFGRTSCTVICQMGMDGPAPL